MTTWHHLPAYLAIFQSKSMKLVEIIVIHSALLFSTLKRTGFWRCRSCFYDRWVWVGALLGRCFKSPNWVCYFCFVPDPLLFVRLGKAHCFSERLLEWYASNTWNAAFRMVCATKPGTRRICSFAHLSSGLWSFLSSTFHEGFRRGSLARFSPTECSVLNTLHFRLPPCSILQFDRWHDRRARCRWP